MGLKMLLWATTEKDSTSTRHQAFPISGDGGNADSLL